VSLEVDRAPLRLALADPAGFSFLQPFLEPARVYVQVKKRPKLACPRCKQGVAVAPASDAPLPEAPGLMRSRGVGFEEEPSGRGVACART
jgi:hypothetical protein